MAVIYTFPADIQGCGYYRLIFAANVLANQGHDVRVMPPGGNRGISGHNDFQGNLRDVTAPPDADVMVFQRVTFARIAAALPTFRRRGIAVVVDMDDDLDRIDPRNPAFRSLHKRAGTEHTTVTAAQACAHATLVTVSTPALLKRYAPGGNGVVLPNFVPEEFLRIPRFDSPVFGWGGSVHSHPGDLQAMGSSVNRLMAEGHQFRVVGPPAGAREALGLPVEPDTTQALPIDRWALGLSTLGVGVAPLADTAFNISKSRLKMVEYAAVGVPSVFSPRDDYMRLHKATGIGTPAGTPKDWYRELKKLITDGGYRAEKSAADRAAAAELTYERNAWLWLQAWDDALKAQRAGSALLKRTGQPKPQKAHI